MRLEEIALDDDYFVSRNLYPNVDFYSGILLRAIGIPTNMFTVMFAIGRMPGWIAHWREVRYSDSRICRPRQLYIGATARLRKCRMEVATPLTCVCLTRARLPQRVVRT